MTTTRLIPLYSSRGDAEAFLAYSYIYNRQGDWIGWVTPEREVYSVHGDYIGWLNGDQRILRRQSEAFDRPKRLAPPIPQRLRPPGLSPLPPMMSELPFGIIDVLRDAPELLPTPDCGESLKDMD